MILRCKNNGIVFSDEDLYYNYQGELAFDELTEEEYPFNKWIEDLLDTNEYEVIGGM